MKMFERAEKMSHQLDIISEKIISPLGLIAHEELCTFDGILDTKKTPKNILTMLFGDEEIVELLEFTLDLRNWILINQEPWLVDIYDPDYDRKIKVEEECIEETQDLQEFEMFWKFCRLLNEQQKFNGRYPESYQSLTYDLQRFKFFHNYHEE